MAEKLCELKKKGGGGGKYTETSLWTNSAPTSSYSGGDVTLSESVEQYKYIKIKCRVSSSNAGTFSTIYSVDDLKTFMANSVSSGCGHIAIYDSSNNRHSRGIQYKDSTTINIKVAYQDGTTTQNNANCIPIEILGLNELAQGKSGGPMFEIQTGGGGSTTNYQGQSITNDASLIDSNIINTQTGSVSVKRNAKGKMYFSFIGRGTLTSSPTFTIHGTVYDANTISRATPQGGINVEFTAGDIISFTSGKSANLNAGTLVFVEDA